MLNFAISIYAVGALTTKVQALAACVKVPPRALAYLLPRGCATCALSMYDQYLQTTFLGKLTRLESSHMRERLLKFLAFKVVMVAAVWSAALEDSPFWLPMCVCT